MNLQIIQIADYRVSASPDDVLVTYALGSCVAIIIYDKTAQIGGLLHVLLPDSRLDPCKAKANPLTFADSGIPILFQKAYALGASKQRLRVGIAGGAQVNASGGFFNVGAENIQATRRILQRAGVSIHSESVGGTTARTVRLHVGTGRISMQQTETGVLRTA
jgi:chemotaxis protein CheD